MKNKDYDKEKNRKNMEVVKAKSAGFCFGVKKAMETVYQQIESNQGKRIYTFGPLIHNEEVVKELKKCKKQTI